MKPCRYQLAAAVLALALAPSVIAGNRHSEIVLEHAAILVEEGLCPALVVGILHEGEREYHALGTFAEGDPRAPDADTLFEIGSITKLFTALLLAEAHRRGELALDDPLGDHLPEGIDPPAFEGAQPTLTHIAQHTSALPRLPSNFNPDPADPYADYDEAMLRAFLDGYDLPRAPGNEYEYSNLGFGLLGGVVTRAADSTFPELVRSRITGPLAMPDTVIDLTEDRRARFAPPHLAGGAPATNWHFAALAGAGALRSTARDMLTFAEAQFEPTGTPLDESIRVIRARRHEGPDGPVSMALAWHVAGDGSTLFHSGGTGGYRSALFVSPPTRTAVVVLANSTEERVSPVCEKILQTLLGMDVAPVEVEKAIDLAPDLLDRLAGTYLHPMIGRYVFTREGDRLMAKLAMQPAFEVYPKSQTEFFYRVVTARIEFELGGEGGPATAVTLYQNGAVMRFERDD